MNWGQLGQKMVLYHSSKVHIVGIFFSCGYLKVQLNTLKDTSEH